MRGAYRALQQPTQRLLLLAAADPTGDATLLWHAAQTLGVPRFAAAAGESEQLLEIGSRVRFRHPLMRSAAYAAATADDRRAAHQALSEATDPELNSERRAWHRAAAATGPDEAVASELERGGGHGSDARGIGGRGCLPGAIGRTDRRAGAAGRESPGCGTCSHARRGVRCRSPVVGRGASPRGRRRATRPCGAAQRTDPVGREAWARGAGLAAPGGEAPRAPERPARPGDVSSRVGRIDSRRPARPARRSPRRRVTSRAINGSSGSGSALRHAA